jgi:hypothetical protein
MQLTLTRKTFTGDSTTGELAIDGRFECFTLEDVVRAVKIHGETAIPNGSFGLSINVSPRFKIRLPRLANVPGFEGVLIHVGNTKKDTDGCILVGQGVAKDMVTQSKAAMALLMAKLEAAQARGEPMRIDVLGAPPVMRGRAMAPAKVAKAAKPKSPAKKAAVKKVAAKKVATKKVATKEAAAPKTAKKKAAPKTAAPKKTAGKKAMPKKAVAKRAVASKGRSR